MKPRPLNHVTLVANAEDSLITINRVISLLRARRFSIVSVGAAQTRSLGVAHLTIVIDGERTPSGRVIASLAKLADVWNVVELDPAETLCRELALMRISVRSGTPDLPSSVTSRNDVRVVHRDGCSIILEAVAEPEEVDAIIQELEPSQLVELVRGRQVAMTRHPPNEPNLEQHSPTRTNDSLKK